MKLVPANEFDVEQAKQALEGRSCDRVEPLGKPTRRYRTSTYTRKGKGMRAFDQNGVLMIKMSPGEAIRTIQSLCKQLLSASPNVGRYEQHLDEDGRDFSIAVEQVEG